MRARGQVLTLRSPPLTMLALKSEEKALAACCWITLAAALTWGFPPDLPVSSLFRRCSATPLHIALMKHVVYHPSYSYLVDGVTDFASADPKE